VCDDWCWFCKIRATFDRISRIQACTAATDKTRNVHVDCSNRSIRKVQQHQNAVINNHTSACYSALLCRATESRLVSGQLYMDGTAIALVWSACGPCKRWSRGWWQRPWSLWCRFASCSRLDLVSTL